MGASALEGKEYYTHAYAAYKIKIRSWHTRLEPIRPTHSPTVIPRPDHILSRRNISPGALKVLYRLREAGYRACLVGGGVRDLLLGREPKDFDVATDARPEQIQQLFRNCRLIGRRFRLAHVQFGAEIVEVATFRASGGDSEPGDAGPTVERAASGRILRDNVYGSIEQDAWRRDFTINTLYYDIVNFAVLDYVGGMADLKAGLIRLIGDPAQHYHEDPVRLLRAVRFAAKLGFRIEPATEAPLHRLGHLLEQIPPARLCDEILKLFLGGCAVQSFELLRHYRLFGWLFPATERSLQHQQEHYPKTLVIRALASTDQRLAEKKPVHPAFLYAALLWEPLCEQSRRLEAEGLSAPEAFEEAAEQVIAEQVCRTALPRRYSVPMQEIWEMQQRLTVTTGKRPLRLLQHPRFRAGYDFLLLRGASDPAVAALGAWWTHLQTLDEAGRLQATAAKAAKTNPRRRRKPRSGPKADTTPLPPQSA